MEQRDIQRTSQLMPSSERVEAIPMSRISTKKNGGRIFQPPLSVHQFTQLTNSRIA
jgi:hypothetical protein